MSPCLHSGLKYQTKFLEENGEIQVCIHYRFSAKRSLTVPRFPQCWRQHCHPKKLTFSLKLSHFVFLSPASCSFSLPSLSFLDLWLSCDHNTCCHTLPWVLWSGFQDRRWRFGLTWENVLALTQGSTEWLAPRKDLASKVRMCIGHSWAAC